jgi:hypothetical protein
MRVMRPEDARRKFTGKHYLSKPTFYDWIKRGIIKKWMPEGVTGTNNAYFISEEEIARVKKLMDTGWTQGRAKIPKAVAKK